MTRPRFDRRYGARPIGMDRGDMAVGVRARDHRRMQPTAAVSSQAAAVSRVLLLADAPRPGPASPGGRADARVRRYRLARLQLDDAARSARHAHLRAAYD